MSRKYQHRASWQSGFARCASEARQPHVWDGLVGFWAPSLGCTGTSRLVDVSGFGNHGTLNGSMTLADWDVGRFGYALDYDGSDDYVDVGNPAALQFGTNDFSIAQWIYPRSLTSPANNQLFMAKDESGARDWTWGMGSYAQGRLTFISVNTADVEAVASTTSIMVANTWQFVVISYRYGSVPNLYHNGTPVTTNNPAAGDDSWAADYNTATSVAIGRRGFAAFEQEFNGLIGDTKVYNKALTFKEVRNLYEVPQAGLELRRWFTGFTPSVPTGVVVLRRRMEGY